MDTRIDEYLIGVATVDITPPVGIPLGGFAVRSMHSSTGVYHPLRAVALAIDDGHTPVLIISVEWVDMGEQSDPIRASVSHATGVPESHIVLIATHTHCAPATRQSLSEHFGWIDQDNYFARAVGKITSAALRAWRGKFPGRLRFGSGTCQFAVNRRLTDPSTPGRTVQAPNPAGPTDQQVGVLTVTSASDTLVHQADGEPRLVAFSYACHPTAGAGMHIGGDYVSYAYDYLDSAFDYAQHCFLQGCAGDQKPRPEVPGATEFGWHSRQSLTELGYQLGRVVEGVARADGLSTVTGAITMHRTVIELETEPASQQEVQAGLEPGAPSHRRRWAELMVERASQGLPQTARVPFEIQTIAFGDALAIIAMSGEMTVEHGLRLKRDLANRFECVLPLGYANNMVGYVPVRRQFAERGYEVLEANLFKGRPGRYMEQTEDQIHRQIATMLE